MRIFIDTEFSDLVDMELISIALIDEDGREFYAERNDFDLSLCTEFTCDVVLPLLGCYPTCIMTKAQICKAVRSWLFPYELAGATLCYDYVCDWGIFRELLDNLPPRWLKVQNIKARLEQGQYEAFFLTTGLAQHHALHDARAIRFAYQSTT